VREQPLTDEEFAKRATEVLEQESHEDVGWWWLSFCDGSRPDGEDFLGACLVKARGFLGAISEARRLGCSPGGEVKGVGPIPLDAEIQDGWTERLLTRAECAEFDRIHDEGKGDV
jgi:hypothetical protein